MSKNTLIRDFNIGFSQLNEDNKQYVLAISQALIFAQTVPQNISPPKEKVTHEKTA